MFNKTVGRGFRGDISDEQAEEILKGARSGHPGAGGVSHPGGSKGSVATGLGVASVKAGMKVMQGSGGDSAVHHNGEEVGEIRHQQEDGKDMYSAVHSASGERVYSQGSPKSPEEALHQLAQMHSEYLKTGEAKELQDIPGTKESFAKQKAKAGVGRAPRQALAADSRAKRNVIGLKHDTDFVSAIEQAEQILKGARSGMPGAGGVKHPGKFSNADGGGNGNSESMAKYYRKDYAGKGRKIIEGEIGFLERKNNHRPLDKYDQGRLEAAKEALAGFEKSVPAKATASLDMFRQSAGLKPKVTQEAERVDGGDVGKYAKKLGLPGGASATMSDEGYSWSKRGGYADTQYRKAEDVAKKLGMKQIDSSSNGSPDGSWIGNGTTYRNATHTLEIHEHIGGVSSDNRHGISLKRNKVLKSELKHDTDFVSAIVGD